MSAKGMLARLQDVDVVFKESSIDEIIQISKQLDHEIENKRVDLRSMVGDRYKDVLTASDAIKSMKSLSEAIVENIQTINDRCERLVIDASVDGNKSLVGKENNAKIKEKEQEYVFAIQIRLAMAINEQIWIAIDKEDYSKAAQLYLLGQHIHTGLRLLKNDVLERMPILKRLKTTIEGLRTRILDKINRKLKTVEINAQETSKNLTALMLLENNTSLELFEYFLQCRVEALQSTVENENHANVRAKTYAMVQCLLTSICLIHDCFLGCDGEKSLSSKRGLIWSELSSIVSEDSERTYAKLQLPKTPLIKYVPEIIKQFHPKCNAVTNHSSSEKELIEKWLNKTSKIVDRGLNSLLALLTSIKGLNLIREEAFKVDYPKNWEEVCLNAHLPKHFSIWNHFFQTLVTERAKELIAMKIASIFNKESKLVEILENENKDLCLKNFNWNEDSTNTIINNKLALTMKTKGYSLNIINVCKDIDKKFNELLIDLYPYIYGKEFSQNEINILSNDYNNNKKCVDRKTLEDCLIKQCEVNAKNLIQILLKNIQNADHQNKVRKSLIYARFLAALTHLCPDYKKAATLSNVRTSSSSSSSNDVQSGNRNGNCGNKTWEKICNLYAECSLKFWENWVDQDTVKNTREIFVEHSNSNMDVLSSIVVLPKWDLIEIQESTDENRVFKSQIKVPSTCSLILQEVLCSLNDAVNSVLPHTLPKSVHLQFIEKNVNEILVGYEKLNNESNQINQTLALQFLFDIKFVTVFLIPRENIKLLQRAQEIAEGFRNKIDPFDLDVFYSYLQTNVKQQALQLQVILGCLLPCSGHLINLGALEKSKEQEKEPCVIALSVPSTNSWFPLLPVTAPVQKTLLLNQQQQQQQQMSSSIQRNNNKGMSSLAVSSASGSFARTQQQQQHASGGSKKTSSSSSSSKSGAASLFGVMATDWFS